MRTNRSSIIRTTTLAFGVLIIVTNQAGFAKEEIVDRKSLEAAMAQKDSRSKISDDLQEVLELLGAEKDLNAKIEMAAKINASGPKPVFAIDHQTGNSIEVYIHLEETNKDTIDALEKLGVEIDIISTRRPIIQAMVPFSAMNSVAALPGVVEISRPVYGLGTAGAVQTEADVIQGTNFIRNGFTFFSFGNGRVDGAGTTIGVISNALFSNSGNVGGIGTNDPAVCNGLQLERVEISGAPELNSELPAIIPNICPFRFDEEGNFIGVNPVLNAEPTGFYGDIQIFPANFSQHQLVPGAANTFNTNFPEGAAILEVVHDVAPGATKIYADGDTSLQHEVARQFLFPTFTTPGSTGNSRNIDVMIDNLVFYGDGRYDGSSSISRGAAEISRRYNIPYFVTASGQSSSDFRTETSTGRFPLFINGFFNPDPRDNRSTVHSWSRTTAFQRDEALDIQVGGQFDEPFVVTLIWDDLWDDLNPRAAVDVDLYLVPKTTLNINDAVATSTNIQNGSGRNPVERLAYFGDADEPLALIMVNKNASAADKLFFTLVIESGTISDSQYLTHGVPGNNSDALPPVISVGHIDTSVTTADIASTTDLIPGVQPGPPSLRSFFKWYENQNSPSVIGYGSVSTASSGARNFEGPSAAVAHLGAFASLLRHRFPQMTPDRIFEVMVDVSGDSNSGLPIPPLALDVTPDGRNAVDTTSFAKSPQYIRSNPFAIYNALVTGEVDAFDSKNSIAMNLIESDSETASTGSYKTNWEPLSTQALGADNEMTNHHVSSMGLELHASSDAADAGWKSPSLEFHDFVTGLSHDVFSKNNTYHVEAMIGSNQTDPELIPDFTIKAVGEDGSVHGLTVSSLDGGFQAAPTNLAGKRYDLFFTPEKDQKYHLEFSIKKNQKTSEDSFVLLRDLKVIERLDTGVQEKELAQNPQ